MLWGNARILPTLAVASLTIHTPLNEIGIPVIDLIDFDFPPWHTAEDTLDKISAESLEIVWDALPLTMWCNLN